MTPCSPLQQLQGQAFEAARRSAHCLSGEAKTASKTSTRDPKSASQCGGERSHRGPGGPTKDQLYEEAKKKNVEGRSTMDKDQLRRAVGRCPLAPARSTWRRARRVAGSRCHVADYH